MTQYHRPPIEAIIDHIIKAGEILDRQPVPYRDKETIGMIIKVHMPIEEMIKEASDKND